MVAHHTGLSAEAVADAGLYSAPGYAFLWNVDEKKIEALASLQDPMYSLPSTLNVVVKVTRTTQYYLGHQNGNTIAGYFLQTYDPAITMPDGTPSTNHAFAQLVIERL
jgi:hypothetical protein